MSTRFYTDTSSSMKLARLTCVGLKFGFGYIPRRGEEPNP